VILATKFGHWPEFDAAGKRIHTMPTPQRVRHYLEASLRRLDTDYIDLYQWHSANLSQALENDLAGTICRLVDEGKIRHAGISVYGPANIRQVARGEFGEVFATIQESINVATLPRFAEALEQARGVGVGIIAREPLGNGMLAGKRGTGRPGSKMARDSRDPHQAQIRSELSMRIRPILESAGRTMVQGLIRFALQAGVSTVIPGCKSVAQVKENLTTCETPELTADDLEQIRMVYENICEEFGEIHPYAMPGNLGTI
jgi:aryl-alcohol dehydrogenase-like predicted oxidoreductase